VLPFGQGNGSIGPGQLATTDMWVGRARDGGAEKAAEIRPAKATSSAKMRMAVFIFGNLSIEIRKGEFSLSGSKSYSNHESKSIFFI
jgi:hypothetical protein